MHDHLDNSIKNRQPTGDEVVDMLNNTRPVGRTAHRDELEERLLAQLQSNNERFSNMQAVHSGRLISFRKFPAILAATLTFLIIGGALMIFNLGNGTDLFGASQGRGSATPTPVQAGCDVHHLRLIDFHVPVDVYSRDDENSELIGALNEGTFEIMGADQEGDWIVLLWDENIVGWIHFAEFDETDYTIQVCIQTTSPAPELQPTVVPSTAERPTLVPTSTPFIVVDGTPLASPPVLRSFIEAAETLSIYASDDTESEVVHELEEGDIVEVIGQNYDGQWLVVRLDLGYVGWISLDDGDKFILTEGLIYSDPETGEVRELDATPTEVPTATPFPPTALPPDEQ